MWNVATLHEFAIDSSSDSHIYKIYISYSGLGNVNNFSCGRGRPLLPHKNQLRVDMIWQHRHCVWLNFNLDSLRQSSSLPILFHSRGKKYFAMKKSTDSRQKMKWFFRSTRTKAKRRNNVYAMAERVNYKFISLHYGVHAILFFRMIIVFVQRHLIHIGLRNNNHFLTQ